MVPASAPATKKIQTRKIAKSDVTRASGYWARNSKSATASLVAAAALIAPPSLVVELDSRRPEDGEPDHAEQLGARSTPTTNSRIVRPREMRAINTPT